MNRILNSGVACASWSCAVVFASTVLVHAQNITIEGVTRTVSMYSGISSICSEFYEIDDEAVRKYWQVIFDSGIAIAGAEKFRTMLEAEMIRRSKEVEITGRAQWCQYQRANQEQLGLKDIFLETRTAASEAPLAQPQEPPCVTEFGKLHDETQKRSKTLQAAMERAKERKELPQQEVCVLYKRFEEAQGKLIKYAKEKSVSCGIPPKTLADLERAVRIDAALRAKWCGVSSPQQNLRTEGAEKTQEVKPKQNEVVETEPIIQEKCRSEWADDFRMQAFCLKQQRAAVITLSTGKPQDIPQDMFVTVRRKCTGEWPNDFRMRAFCEKQQFSAIRELRE
jgi:hypothetical protein